MELATKSDELAVLDRWVCETFSGQEDRGILFAVHNAPEALTRLSCASISAIVLVGSESGLDTPDSTYMGVELKSGWRIYWR